MNIRILRNLYIRGTHYVRTLSLDCERSKHGESESENIIFERIVGVNIYTHSGGQLVSMKFHDHDQYDKCLFCAILIYSTSNVLVHITDLRLPEEIH